MWNADIESAPLIQWEQDVFSLSTSRVLSATNPKPGFTLVLQVQNSGGNTVPADARKDAAVWAPQNEAKIGITK
jgi:hypothetical protein